MPDSGTRDNRLVDSGLELLDLVISILNLVDSTLKLAALWIRPIDEGTLDSEKGALGLVKTTLDFYW